MSERDKLVLLGDEAVALGAVHAGISAAYGYPGTPSTEILEWLIERSKRDGGFVASWCTNEKTAAESALGASFAGRRALVTMKHVGLNVAADPFVNAGVCRLGGGLVFAVADDPGMHSSQDEQDSRFYADFAMVPCLEPTTAQEAYDMTREAFEISERFRKPVILRLVTRLSHSRAVVEPKEPRPANPVKKPEDVRDWMLLPAYARRNYAALCDAQKDIQAWSEERSGASLSINPAFRAFGVVTTGLGLSYYRENLPDLTQAPSHLHVSSYPVPLAAIRRLAASVDRIVVVEEGQPYLERILRGAFQDAAGVASKGAPLSAEGRPVAVCGKLDGTLPRAGELDPDIVRVALGLAPRKSLKAALPELCAKGSSPAEILQELPGRPPQLCSGCPHIDSYASLKEALSGLDSCCVTADIGCYALGALPPYDAIETIVCMGASIGMARGAADSGIQHAVAVIGDSTFWHSGVTNLVDAVSANAPITVMILDNDIVAMTGCQPTILPSERLERLAVAVGVDPEHVVRLEASPGKRAENVAALRREILHRGPSVVILSRVCIEAFRQRKKGASA